MSNASHSVHRAAAEGYAVNADQYVRGRPDYPEAIDAWLREMLGLRAGRMALDLGAGTGKFTARLARTGARIIAVEPVAAMRGKLAAALPAVDVRAGSADTIPAANASVDAVVCAQAFHWFATPTALDEIRRVLNPGGRLGLVWNARDASVPWVAALNRIVDAHEGDAPRYASGAWRAAFPHDGFGPLHESLFRNAHAGSPEDVIIDRVRSTSFIAALPADEEAEVVARLRALIAAEPFLAGKDEVTVPYTTSAFWAEKVGN